MPRSKNPVPRPGLAADRTVGELVAWLTQQPTPPGITPDTARHVAGAWRRLVRAARPEDWETTRLGALDTAALLDAYAATTSSSNSLTAMRTRLPKGLNMYEAAIAEGRDALPPARRAVAPPRSPATAGDSPDAGTVPAEVGTAPHVEAPVGVAGAPSPDRPPSPWPGGTSADDELVAVTVRLARGRTYSFRLPADCTQEELALIKATVQAYALLD